MNKLVAIFALFSLAFATKGGTDRFFLAGKWRGVIHFSVGKNSYDQYVCTTNPLSLETHLHVRPDRTYTFSIFPTAWTMEGSENVTFAASTFEGQWDELPEVWDGHTLTYTNQDCTGCCNYCDFTEDNITCTGHLIGTVCSPMVPDSICYDGAGATADLNTAIHWWSLTKEPAKSKGKKAKAKPGKGKGGKGGKGKK